MRIDSCLTQIVPFVFHQSLAVLLLLTIGLSAWAQDEIPDTSDRVSAKSLARMMKKLDKDGNGQYEKAEVLGAWKRFGNLDTNNDEVVTLEELSKLRKKPASYLETDGERKLEIVYKTLEQKKLGLDLYYPIGTAESDSPHPLIIYTHGGGWASGSKLGIARGLFKPVFQELLRNGFAIASVDYRLCRAGNSVMMRDCVIDCKDAARYLAQNSESLSLDTDLFFVMGDSAGGQIAQMMLLTPPDMLAGDEALQSASYRMVAGVSWYGPCDFEKSDLFNHDDRDNFRDRFGPRILGENKDAENKLELYREMSPINYLKANSPPLLMIQGDSDTTIPVKHAHYIREKADAIGAPVETMIIRNSGHNWRQVDAPIEPSKEAIMERTVQFFNDHLQRVEPED